MIHSIRFTCVLDTNVMIDEYEVLDCLRRNGLNDTANYLHALL